MYPICLIAIVILLTVLIPAVGVAQMQTSSPHSQAGQEQHGQAPARSTTQMDMPEMPDMQMPKMSKPANPSSALLMEESSGTSAQPRGWAMPMMMTHRGAWQYSWMAQAFVVDVQQSHVTTTPGSIPRAGDKLYSTNWGMLGAQRTLAGGTAELRTMLSLEPATITRRRYPELFQTGETAYGQPIVDGQHPHNLLMEVSAQYAHSFGNSVLNLYYAPVGDPAIGPTAYPHRASAAELPQAPLGHHYEDSTHISDNVVAAEAAWRSLHVEVGGFHGREPGENRWTVGCGGIDSWAARLTWLPAHNWQAQLSMGRLHYPEATSTSDEVRTTASVEYSAGARAASVIWGRAYKTNGHYAVNAFTAEGELPVAHKNLLTGRFEWSQRDELFSNQPALPTLPQWFDVAAFTAGYTREVGRWHGADIGMGANGTAYKIDNIPAIISIYSGHPWGASVYLRLRLNPASAAQ
jgi:hypothetical protein